MTFRSEPISHITFAKMFKALIVLVPKYSPTLKDDQDVAIWYDSFKHFDQDSITKAFRYARDNCEEFPSLKKLKEYCEQQSGDIPKDPFDQIIKLASNANRIPEGTHPTLLLAAKKLGGFATISDWNPDHYAFKRKEFKEIWQEVVSSVRENKDLLMLQTSKFDTMKLSKEAMTDEKRA